MEWSPENLLSGEFCQVARKVYEDDPYWIPEDPGAVANIFGSQNNYFENNQVWLSAVSDKARLVGFFNPSLLIEGKKTAYFGYWETQDEVAPNLKLFNEFEAWAKKKGAEIIYGPINFSTFGNYRLQLNRFGSESFPGEPHNPEYYLNIMEALGYKLHQRYFSISIPNWDNMGDAENQKIEKLKTRLKKKFTWKPLTPEYWIDHLKDFYLYIDMIFSDNFGYSGICFEDFQKSNGEAYARRFCPHSSVVALDDKEIISGFSISIPDYGPLICQGAKERFSINDISYEKHFHLLTHPHGLGKTIGVQPKYQEQGLAFLLVGLSIQRARPLFDSVSASLAREGNPSAKIMASFFGVPGSYNRYYGLYAKELN